MKVDLLLSLLLNLFAVKGFRPTADGGSSCKGHSFFNRLYSSTPSNDPTDIPMWKEKVQFVDLSVMNIDASPTARDLPLFLLSGAFYPQVLNTHQ